MADLATLNGVYNHYLTTYAPKSSTALDTHKKSELRGIYNSIIKLNKESPLYILDNSADSKSYAIGLKEGAIELQHVLGSLGGLNETELLNKKVAYSSNESIASAKYIGDSAASDFAPELSIEVRSLASPQINLGSYLPPDEPISLKEDTYSFDLNIHGFNYEFQFQIHEDDTNRDVQERLKRLINNADVGLHAKISEDADNTALKLTSQKSGLNKDNDFVFQISDNQTSKASGIVDLLGIGEMTRKPSNAEFILNGSERSSVSNTFTVEKMYEISLNGVSETEGEATNIGIKPDTESLTENLRLLFNGYNQFLRSTLEYTKSHPKSNQLLSEMWHIAGEYATPLSNIGVNITEDGSVELDEDSMKKAVADGSIRDGFTDIQNFAKDLYRKSGQVSLNPMQYVDKTIVAYKNPGKNFATPYITSAYSGMLFNSYC
ncbi:MAG: flagellar capping protein [Lachnospiraceae bacterium]|nr:flagellar capping protein [Lachnospiraceae bacterium]